MFSALQGRDSRRNRSMKDFIINLDPWGRARSWLHGARALLYCKILLNICPVAGDGLCAHVHLAGLSLCSISKPLASPASPQEAARTASAGRSLPLAWHKTRGRGFLCKGGPAAAPPSPLQSFACWLGEAGYRSPLGDAWTRQCPDLIQGKKCINLLLRLGYCGHKVVGHSEPSCTCVILHPRGWRALPQLQAPQEEWGIPLQPWHRTASAGGYGQTGGKRSTNLHPALTPTHQGWAVLSCLPVCSIQPNPASLTIFFFFSLSALFPGWNRKRELSAQERVVLVLGTPAPTGREKPARLPLYLGFYQAIMVENWKETDTREAKTLPLVERTTPAHKGCSVRCGRGSTATLVPWCLSG